MQTFLFIASFSLLIFLQLLIILINTGISQQHVISFFITSVNCGLK